MKFLLVVFYLLSSALSLYLEILLSVKFKCYVNMFGGIYKQGSFRSGNTAIFTWALVIISYTKPICNMPLVMPHLHAQGPYFGILHTTHGSFKILSENRLKRKQYPSESNQHEDTAFSLLPFLARALFTSPKVLGKLQYSDIKH